jgi:hypothetical protein
MTPYRCSYALSRVLEGISLISFRNVEKGFGLMLDCGQDREGPLAGRASSYEVTPSWSRVEPGGGRRIVRRPARMRQPVMGPGRPRERER